MRKAEDEASCGINLDNRSVQVEPNGIWRNPRRNSLPMVVSADVTMDCTAFWGWPSPVNGWCAPTNIVSPEIATLRPNDARTADAMLESFCCWKYVKPVTVNTYAAPVPALWFGAPTINVLVVESTSTTDPNSSPAFKSLGYISIII